MPFTLKKVNIHLHTITEDLTSVFFRWFPFTCIILSKKSRVTLLLFILSLFPTGTSKCSYNITAGSPNLLSLGFLFTELVYCKCTLDKRKADKFVARHAKRKTDKRYLLSSSITTTKRPQQHAKASLRRTTTTLHLKYTCTVWKHLRTQHPKRTIFIPPGLLSATDCEETQHFTNIKPL